MNEINTENPKKSSNKVFSWKNLPYALSFIALLNLSNPSKAEVVNTSKYTPEITEVLEDSDIITYIEQRTGVKLPKGYAEKIRNFMINNKTLKKEIATRFTKDFIEKEMQSDRGGISKENKILFICCAVGYNYNQDFYTGDDGDDNRMSEFEKAIDSIEACQRRYKEEFLLHMQQISADADRRTSDADKRISDADKRISDADKRISDADKRISDAIKNIMHTDSTRIKEHMEKFYDTYIQTPNIVKQEDIDFMRKSAKEIIASCIKYGIDYRAILLEKVGDEKKVDAILEFYGIKDPDIAQAKLDYNIVDHYNPAQDASSEVKERWYKQRELNTIRRLQQIELAHALADKMIEELNNENLNNENLNLAA